MHTLVRITTRTKATPGAKRRSLPITPTRSLETPEGIRQNGCRKDSIEYSNALKSCCLVSTLETYYSTDAALTKRQQRPKRCCRITTDESTAQQTQ